MAVGEADAETPPIHAVERESFLADPSPDGLYGLKLVVDTGPVNGFRVSRAQVDAKLHMLTVRRGTCLARGRGGRCVERQRADAPLFTISSCPASRRYNVQLQAIYPPPTASQTTTLELPCPRYVP